MIAPFHNYRIMLKKIPVPCKTGRGKLATTYSTYFICVPFNGGRPSRLTRFSPQLKSDVHRNVLRTGLAPSPARFGFA